MASLIVRRGASDERMPLVGAEISIGRDPTNTLALPAEDTVSKHHARLIHQDGLWSVADVGSTNGTFVNDVRTNYRELQSGDEILLGSVRLIFLADDPADPSVPLAGPPVTGVATPDVSHAYLDGGDEWRDPQQALPDTRPDTGRISGPMSSRAEPAPSARPPTRAQNQSPGRPPQPATQPTGSQPTGVSPPGRRDGHRGVVRGLARNVQIRPDENERSTMAFRVDSYDDSGNRLPAASIHVKTFRRGHLSEGEEVVVEGTWQRGTLEAKEVRNLTTGADIVQGWSKAEKAAAAVFFTIFGAIALFILSAVALAILTQGFGPGTP
jgi:pSer/pThr/pTyr-binding forkhead associated (FHA) protein